MKQFISPLLKISLCTVSYLWAINSAAQAQVTSDGTVNTQVDQNGNVAEITGGETRGSNLFHSFQDFSVRTGNEAFFNNADSISNIFSRVTGGNISNIDGLIRANGSSSLFLINPAGIIFGEGARLDIGGSFYGSTASSILFEDGEFSAADLENPPLLTVNAPIGLGFRDNPGDITVNGDGLGRRNNNDLIDTENALRVSSTDTLGLIGGNLNLESATLKTSGGRIELGSVASNDRVSFISTNEGFSLGYEGVENFGDINLFKTTTVDASGLISGDVRVQGNNITLTEGSRIEASTVGKSPADLTPGIVEINAADTIVIDNSGVHSRVYPGALGDAGSININAIASIVVDGENANSSGIGIFNDIRPGGVGNTGGLNIISDSLRVTNGASISTSVFGEGDGGSININAINTVTFDGENTIGNFSGAFSAVQLGGVGNAGEINITTGSLEVLNGAVVDSGSFGEGNASSIIINAVDTIIVDGEDRLGFPSGVFSTIDTGVKGNAGNINITTGSLQVSNGGQINANTFGEGDAASININAIDTVTFDGENTTGISSSAASVSGEGAIGNSGSININTDFLIVVNGAQINVSTAGEGDAASININAIDTIIFDGVGNIDGNPSGSGSQVLPGAIGNSGGVNITTGSIFVTNGAQISANTFGQGNAGSVTINATDTVTFDGEDMNGSPSAAGSQVDSEAIGDAGGVNIITDSLNITNGAKIDASTFGQGNSGSLTVKANSVSLGKNASINATTQSGEGGSINLLIAEDITLRNNSFISAQAFNNANGGNLSIDARFIIAFPDGNNDILASAQQGIGGNISINAESLFGIEPRDANPENGTNDISASSEVSGLEGTVNINSSDINPIQGVAELPQNIVVPEQTTAQACRANRELAAQSGFTISGKGGVPPSPELPLSSQNIVINGEISASRSTIPQAIQTSQGEIQPARGIKVTESGEIILTAYRTNNAGERIPESSRNCGRV